jgi:hypothetical protein
MTVPTDPRRLLARVLGLFGLDGGNARALSNARGMLDALHAARARVDALEFRIRHGAPTALGVGWPVSPPASQPPRPAMVEVGAAPTGQPALGTSTSGHSSNASQPQSRLSSSMRSMT